MPFYRVGGMNVHIRMTKPKGGYPAHCQAPADYPEGKCLGISGYLCDWPVGDEGDTCSMPLCDEHKGEAGPDVNYCPKHLAVFQSSDK